VPAGALRPRRITTKVGNHTFRATGVTAYLKNGGTLENAAAMANHASTHTTQLYDRRRDKISLDEASGLRFEARRRSRAATTCQAERLQGLQRERRASSPHRSGAQYAPLLSARRAVRS
jgi:integrase